MWSTEKADPLNLDYLLKYTTEYDIYAHFIGTPFKVGRVISSPLRKDIHPSFSVFKSNSTGYLLFKDLATNNTGNCIHFVAALKGISYLQALILVKNEIVKQDLTITKKGKEVKDYYTNQTKSIAILRRNFCKVDDEYWSQFGLVRSDLKEYNVLPIEKYLVNGEEKPYYYTIDCPMYAYQVFNKYKIYRPYADKAHKWRTSCTSYDIQGWEQLPKNKLDTLIITKSLKDVMCLKKLGYIAIAPNGEGHNIPNVVLEKIEQLADNVIMFYDRDTTGVMAVRKFLKTHKYNFIFIPKRYKTKDISDFIKEYGMDKAKELMNKLLHGKDKKR